MDKKSFEMHWGSTECLPWSGYESVTVVSDKTVGADLNARTTPLKSAFHGGDASRSD